MARMLRSELLLRGVPVVAYMGTLTAVLLILSFATITVYALTDT